MKVNIEKVFPLDATVDQAWTLLQDIPATASCMPGAEITEQVDDNNYKGMVKVKIGPATASFKGDIEIKGIDASRRELQMLGKGADVKGTSSASMDLTACVRETDDGKSELVGNAEVAVTGKMASLGGRMMTQVSDQILKQFGNNFSSKVVSVSNPAAGGDEGSSGQTTSNTTSHQASELNGLALFWGVITGFFKSLFGGAK